MRTALIALSLALPAASVSPGLTSDAAAQRYSGARPSAYDAPPRARVWLENGRDSYRRGERLRVRFSTSDDGYVAVIHIDPDGNLDFLYPDSPFDREFVRAGRTYALPRGGFGNGPLVRGSGGIGYLYMIASPVPLDFGYFRGRGYGWDWSYAGRGVYGDPFWALEQVTRTLLPDRGYTPYTVDYASYHVGGRVRYPAYACGRGYPGYSVVPAGFRGGWGYNPYSDSCDRLDLFLRNHPNYFDPDRYRGDRRVVFRDYGPWQPGHGYKAAPDDRRTAVPRPPAQAQPPARRATPRTSGPAGSAGPAARAAAPERAAEKSGASGPAPEKAAEPARRRPGGG